MVQVDPKTRLRRHPDQGSHSRSDLDAILNRAFVGHLGVLDKSGQPFVVPTVYGIGQDCIYLHGSVASMSLRKDLQFEATFVVTIVEGLVIARSIFNHSVNYHSCVIYGELEEIADPEHKLEGLKAISEHIAPGQWDYARRPNSKEIRKTSLKRMALEKFSVKSSEGPPSDSAGEDSLLDVWAGVIPLWQVRGDLVADPDLMEKIFPPAHLEGFLPKGVGS